jgi:hypothetical protein
MVDTITHSFAQAGQSDRTDTVNLSLVTGAVIGPDDPVRRNQGNLQLGQFEQIERIHRLKDDFQGSFEPLLNILVAITVKE